MSESQILIDPAAMKEILPLLPLKGTVIFPHQVQGLGVGRPKSLRALEAALAGEPRLIVLAAQKEDDLDNPGPDDIYRTGSVCRILQVGKQPDGVLQVIVEGVVRAEILEYAQEDPFFAVRYTAKPDATEKSLELEALMRGLASQFERFARLSRSIPPEQFVAVMQVEEPGKLADLVAQHLNLKLEERQRLLEMSVQERLELLGQVLSREISILELERKIQNRVRKQMEKSQREYFLKEQMKAIQHELGESDERQAEVTEYRKKIEAANLPEHVKEKALEELSRLEKMPPMVAEAVVVRTYLDWILALPWSVRTEDRLEIDEARHILDEDHYGLEKVKERVIEYLAVRKLSPESKGPILCFIGPPGTGKTSVGKSIARALGRKFVRVSLGGVRDEAEIRGHRRTYVGAAGAHRPGPEAGREQEPGLHAGRDRQVGHRFPRRSLGGVAGGAGPGAEPRLQRPLPGVGAGSLRSHVHRHRQHPGHGAPGAARPHGSHPLRRLHGRGENQDRRALPHPEAAKDQRPEGGARAVHRRGAAAHRPRVHARGRRAQHGAGDGRDLPQGGHRSRARVGETGQGDDRQPA